MDGSAFEKIVEGTEELSTPVESGVESPPPLKTREQRINALIDWLENGKGPKLNMGEWYESNGMDPGDYADFDAVLDTRIKGDNWCGTSACIAGHAFVLAVSAGHMCASAGAFIGGISQEAAEWLKLSSYSKQFLFHTWVNSSSVKEAVLKLKYVRDHKGDAPRKPSLNMFAVETFWRDWIRDNM